MISYLTLLAITPLLIPGLALSLPTPQDALKAANSIIHPLSLPSPAVPDASVAITRPIPETESSVVNDEGDYIHITSTRHPDHSVSIKETTGWCDPDVRSFSGLLDISKEGSGKNMFFHFFESRSDPASDPVVMWINGGPGCASSIGLFIELGPCKIKDHPKTANDTVPNPYSWNNKANVFFLDQPIGVGYSQPEHGQTVSTTEEAALDVQAFIELFFDAFKEYQGREFHMAGESYAGRYLPLFASAVFDGNDAMVAAGKRPINLKSIMIGNGQIDFFTEVESYFEYQCTPHYGAPVPIQPIAKCVGMAEALPRCHDAVRLHCLEQRDEEMCAVATAYCTDSLRQAIYDQNLSIHDVRKSCTPEEMRESQCFPESKLLERYLNLPDVRHIFGIKPGSNEWTTCSDTISRGFTASHDDLGHSWLYISALLERGVRVLNYAGTYDMLCNHISNERTMAHLEWSGQKEYNLEELTDWKVEGKVAGAYKTFKNLSLLKVFDAGHLVPLDRPEEALAMLNAWLKEVSFGS